MVYWGRVQNNKYVQNNLGQKMNMCKHCTCPKEKVSEYCHCMLCIVLPAGIHVTPTITPTPSCLLWVLLLHVSAWARCTHLCLISILAEFKDRLNHSTTFSLMSHGHASSMIFKIQVSKNVINPRGKLFWHVTAALCSDWKGYNQKRLVQHKTRTGSENNPNQ